MCRDARSASAVSPGQAGFSLPLALFIIVVLGLLATVLYRVVALNQLSVVQETLSARAFLAAESGAQAGMLRLFPISGTAASCSGSPGVNQSFNSNGLVGCEVTLVCNGLLVDGEMYYQMTSTGICRAGNLRASRTIEVSARQLPE
ncbi:MAG TPA: hypothetical protein VFV64_03660 [Permianibacter sp.]|nr:hypothetical protein [Permianibacter sp.]